MEQIQLAWDAPPRQYTVSEITARIGALLTTEFSNVRVAGEISGLKVAPSGHAYFTLKDSGAQLRCACWKTCFRLLRFKPQDGLDVVARGRIEVYEPRGEYQFIVEAVEPVGQGALQLAFEQLKAKLAAEGLFEAARKKPLPKLAQRIGIVTSPSGAVIRDILHVMSRRFRGLSIRLYPAQVQGAGAAAQVIEGIRYFSDGDWAELIIVARGGGSLEDLWTFNEESVARAIVASPVPVVSAIGHETDFTIADFVADLRAATPSAAAEMVTASREAILDRLTGLRSALTQLVRFRIASAARKWSATGVTGVQASIGRRINRGGQRIDDLDFRLRRNMQTRLRSRQAAWAKLELSLRRFDTRWRIESLRGRIARLEAQMTRAAEARLATHRTKLAALVSALDTQQPSRRLEYTRASLARSSVRLEQLMPMRMQALAHRLAIAGSALHQLNPLAILERGFAVVQDQTGQLIRDPAQVNEESVLSIRVARGEFRTRPIKEE